MTVDLAAIKARLKEAELVPVDVEDRRTGGKVGLNYVRPNEAAARLLDSDLPALIAEVERLRGRD